jgi:hypothetical protein
MNKEELARQYSPLALAYLGDGVYELFVRGHILRQGNCQNRKLHDKAKDFASCAAQERFLSFFRPHTHPTQSKGLWCRIRCALPFCVSFLPLLDVIHLVHTLKKLVGSLDRLCLHNVHFLVKIPLRSQLLREGFENGLDVHFVHFAFPFRY